MKKSTGIFYVVASALPFGVTPVLASRTYEMGSNPETLTFYRNFPVLPILLVPMLTRPARFRVP